jgi:hypothetical protein
VGTVSGVRVTEAQADDHRPYGYHYKSYLAIYHATKDEDHEQALNARNATFGYVITVAVGNNTTPPTPVMRTLLRVANQRTAFN